MAEETIIEQQPQTTNIWGDPVEVKQEEKIVVEENKVEETLIEKKEEEEIVEPNVWLEREFGWKDAQSAKAEVEELRKYRQEQKPIEFASDQAKKMFDALVAGKEDDIYSILEQKRNFDKVEKLNVDDAMQAAQLIQLGFQLQYKDLSQREIQDLFDEKYERPAKPQQAFDQTDEEYKMVTEQWQARCDAIERKIVRDAKILRPDVLKLKPDFVLPNIQKPQAEQRQPELSQEELAKVQKSKNDWLEAAKTTANAFNGFSTVAKFKEGDKEVEIPVSYGLSNEEKAEVVNMATTLVNNDFDVFSIFKERWVNKDGTDNINQVVKDLTQMMFGDKAASKFANEAANQRFELYLKSKKNININDGNSGGGSAFANDGKTENQKLQENIWG